jgi:sulfate permease, SulP family
LLTISDTLLQDFSAKSEGLRRLLNYDRAWLLGDLLAGITVAAYLVPQCMAYGELAGLSPVAGLWAILPPLMVYAVMGSSPQLSVGPEAGSALLTAAAIRAVANGPLAAQGGNYASLAAMLALLVGGICLIGYLARLGFIANLLSQPILVGYLAGVSLIMMVGQLANITGLKIVANTVPGALVAIGRSLGHCHVPTLLLGTSVLIFLFAAQRWLPKLPAPLISVLLATIAVVVWKLDALGVAVVGEIPAGLPFPALPHASWSEVQALLPAALGIALVGYSDNVLTARAFASRNGYQIVADRELLALSVCNLSNGLMQGFPISSSGSRTALGESLGNKSQLFSLVAVVMTVAVLLFLRPVLALFPKAALGAIVIFAASRLIEIPEFVKLYRLRRSELALALATAGGVLLLDITTGVLLAVVLSVLDLLWRLGRPADGVEWQDAGLIYRYDGPLCFINAQYFGDRVRQLAAKAPLPLKRLTVDGTAIGSIDATALGMLVDLKAELAGQAIELTLIDLRPPVLQMIQRSGEDLIGK